MGSELTRRDIEWWVKLGLEEDLGPGDITTESILRDEGAWEAVVTAKESLVICGLDIFRAVFTRLDPQAEFLDLSFRDGGEVPEGVDILRLRAGGAALLKGERTALNILQRLSGIATLTRRFVERARPVKVLDTRKTTPGLRVFEKYAVRCGGGQNHRFGLYDAVMIKDNHIQVAGSIGRAVERVRQNLPAECPSIEVETRNLEEVRQAVKAGADIILLDNMPLEMIEAAVKIIHRQSRIEVSGSITLDRLKELSGTGVDFVSAGALTHSARAVDISMNILTNSGKESR